MSDNLRKFNRLKWSQIEWSDRHGGLRPAHTPRRQGIFTIWFALVVLLAASVTFATILTLQETDLLKIFNQYANY
jgi:hypothetical protein